MLCFGSIDRKSRRLACAIFLTVSSAIGLSGCSSAFSAWVETAQGFVKPSAPEAATAQLQPNFQYLRATVNGIPTLLVRGGSDLSLLDPKTNQPIPVELWYSGDGEVVRLRDGRIAGTSGIITDWRSVSMTDVPQWQTALQAPQRYVRTRDVMPNYLYGLTDEVVVRAIDAPSQPDTLSGVSAQDLNWFEESARPLDAKTDPLPPSRYAVNMRDGQNKVVYSEQCLSRQLCLTFQLWPAATGFTTASAPPRDPS